MTPKRNPPSSAYRWAIAARCVAAAVGGFALTSAAAIVLAWLLIRTGAMPRVTATAAATLVSFAVWAGIIMWVFTTASLQRVWLNLMVPALALSVLAWMLGSTA